MAENSKKEHPVLFSGEMVRAILDGRKTQARRVIKYQPPRQLFHLECLSDGEWRDEEVSLGKCPCGVPGERLWVRETFRLWDYDFEGVSVEYRDGNHEYRIINNKPRWLHNRNYRQDKSIKNWRPPIHMPRWASRITLEITDVRVERLNDISEEDAKVEGITLDHALSFGSEWFDCGVRDKNGDPVCLTHKSARSAFAHLWESISGEGSWDKNPYVWAITFKKL